MMSPQVLVFPKSSEKYVEVTDLCDHPFGRVLMLQQENKSFYRWEIGPVHNKAEKNYNTTEQEFLAIVRVFLTLRRYLMDHAFRSVRDYSSLRWVLSLADPTGRF